MVHHRVTSSANNSNLKKDNISKSHSWIYGSVKLPSDIPFGYGGYDSDGSGGHTMDPSHHQSLTPSGRHPLQIPRCQKIGTPTTSSSEFYTCSCNNEFCNFLTASTTNGIPGGSKSIPPPPCLSCQHSQILPNRKLNSQLLYHPLLLHQQHHNQHQDPNNKKSGNGSSVRKLTWKSLKQAVKKRPTLDSLMNGGGTRRQPEDTSKAILNYGISRDDFCNGNAMGSPGTPNYFFPEKKNQHFYASCLDLVGSESGSHVTASVRLRPKRSRATWSFPNEFGPVPNYQVPDNSGNTLISGNGIYHSEWDLRQYMPYEQWITESDTIVNPFLGNDTYTSPVGNVKVMTGSQKGSGVNKPMSTSMSLPEGKLGNNNNGTHYLVPSKNNGTRLGKSDLYTNGGVKRFSNILHNESKIENDSEDNRDSDEESIDNSGDDGAVRIAGQGIFMVTAMSNGHHSSSTTGHKVTRSNSSVSVKFKANKVSTTAKGNHHHPLLLSSSRSSEADGIWSDPQTTEQNQTKQISAISASTSWYSNSERNQNVTQLTTTERTKTETKGLVRHQKVIELNTFKQSSGISDTVPKNAPKPSKQIMSPQEIAEESGICPFAPVTMTELSKKNQKENLYTKNGSTVTPSPMKISVKSNGKRNGSSGSSSESDNSKYGALRRRRGSRVSNSGKNNLLQETIYEEESESLDGGDGELHSVKIVVTQTGGMDYVKPILKTRILPTLTENEILQERNMSTQFDLPSTSMTLTLSHRQTPKKVQFNSTEDIVICSTSGESMEEDSESHDDEEVIDISSHDYGHTQKRIIPPLTVENEECEIHRSPCHGKIVVTEPLRNMSLSSSQSSSQSSSLGDDKIKLNLEDKTEVKKNKDEILQLNQLKQKHLSPSSNPMTMNVRVNNLKIEDHLKDFDDPKMTSMTSNVISNQPSQVTPPKNEISNNNGSNDQPQELILSKIKKSQGRKLTIMDRAAARFNDQLPGKGSMESQKIINPNSLLFHDTTRIRLNQSRPSLENTFKLIDVTNGATTKEKLTSNIRNGDGTPSNRRIRPSQSFRTTNSGMSVPLRPREPPPPPPSRISSTIPSGAKKISNSNSRTNKSEISLPLPMLGFSTTNNELVKEVAPSHYQNPNIFHPPNNKIVTEKCEAVEKVLMSQPLNSGGNQRSKLRLNPPSTPPRSTSMMDLSYKNPGGKPETKNVEIVSRGNSVSEIRIYSASNVKPIPAPKNPELLKRSRSTNEIHYAASEVFQRPPQPLPSIPNQVIPGGMNPISSRPQSTSVVLILDSTTTDSSDVTGNSITSKNQNLRLSGPVLYPTDQITGSNLPPPLPPPMNGTKRNEDKSQEIFQIGKMTTTQGLIYDDVTTRTNQNLHSSKSELDRLKLMRHGGNDFSPPTSPPPPLPIDTESLHSVYSDVGSCVKMTAFNSLENDIEPVYDDAIGPRSNDASKRPNLETVESSLNSKLKVDEEPLYDDVLNVIVPDRGGDSDSGTETDIPPPLPSSGPPVHLLPEILLELPLIPLPSGFTKVGTKGSISKGTTRLLGEIIEFGKKISGRGVIGGNESNLKMLESIDKKKDPLTISSPTLNHSSISHPSTIWNSTMPPALPNLLSLENGNIIKRKSLEKMESIDRHGDGTGRGGVMPTQILLNELNEKLANLNFTPEDYSTYISKVLISSSSESSGVEEDYNSEKNYSLNTRDDGNGSNSIPTEDNYKLNKLLSETISMARGKFLNSMKPHHGSGILSTNRKIGSDVDEPIYEEINDSNGHPTTNHSIVLRSSSPIYADAFDAKNIFDVASRNEILSFLESIRDRLTAPELARPMDGRRNRKGAEIERNDSGIGSESGSIVVIPPSSILTDEINSRLCKDCNNDTSSNDSSRQLSSHDISDIRSTSPYLCTPCTRNRLERKEIVQEIYETELKYGRDLRIITDEFYSPIQTAGLLTRDQLDQIFLNVGHLTDINLLLSCALKTAITGAMSDEDDLNSVNVGQIFLEIGEKMMSAFDSYCTRQANAGALLTQLEKEKELLRIFLRVSQMENTVLRRMNLPAFLMVPVQRVTRYPLLLSRLLKVTPLDHSTRGDLQLAHEKIEHHLEHMNKAARDVANGKLWRRISIINGNIVGGGMSTGSIPTSISPISRRSSTSEFDGASVRIRKMALDVLDWTGFKDVSIVIESQISFHLCNGGKTLRNVYAMLLARGKDLESLALKMDQEIFFPPKDDIVKDVKLILVRAKNARFSFLREPFCLSTCVISKGEATEFQDWIEINEIPNKNMYYLQGMDREGTSLWLKLLQCHAACVGHWRRRRWALANIMMNGMVRQHPTTPNNNQLS